MDWLQTGAEITLLPRQWAGRNKTLLHRLTPAGQPDYRALAERLTLHQLRHSALTTLADANVSLPLLMGKRRHKNLRSLQRYVHPSAEAVAAMTAAHDPAARRRRY